jgi:hypothetical protein
VALVALATVVPPAPGASSGGAANQRRFSMVLRPQGRIPSGRFWMLPIELHERVMGQILQPLYLRIGGSCWANRAASTIVPIGVRYS